MQPTIQPWETYLRCIATRLKRFHTKCV